MVAKRFGFSWGLRLCAVLFAGGFSLFAAFPSMFTLCLGYGILGGIGVGLSYNLVLNCISKWYLSGYGKVSGLLLMCFAGGSFVLSIVCNILIRAFGWRKTFLILAVIFACTILLCSFYIKHPSKTETKGKLDDAEQDTISSTPKQMILTLSFYLIFFWFTFFSISGTTLVGNAAPLALDLGVPETDVAFIPGLVALCNGLGRIIYGSLLDKIEATTIQVSLSIEMVIGVVCLLICMSTGEIWFLFLGCVLFGNSFGGSAIFCPNIILKEFGKAYYASNLPILNIHVIIVSLAGPILVGKLYEKVGSYWPALWLFLSASSISLIFSCIYKCKKKEHLATSRKK